MLREHGITKIFFMDKGEEGSEKGRTVSPNKESESLPLIYSPLSLYLF
jgi:hypothetical protein